MKNLKLNAVLHGLKFVVLSDDAKERRGTIDCPGIVCQIQGVAGKPAPGMKETVEATMIITGRSLGYLFGQLKKLYEPDAVPEPDEELVEEEEVDEDADEDEEDSEEDSEEEEEGDEEEAEGDNDNAADDEDGKS